MLETKEFAPATGYLNTALRGLPPASSTAAARTAIEDWFAGRLDWNAWLDEGRLVREALATLIGVDAACVGIGHTTSALVGVVATNIPDGATVLVPENEHNANVIPFLGQAHRGVKVQTAPLEELAQRLTSEHAAVAFSLVQSIDGRIADLAAIRTAADATGSLVCVDATQAAGWLPFDAHSCDFLFASSYKWLLGPSGPAFIVVRPDLVPKIRPLQPNWFSCEDPSAAPYGVDFRWAENARRFDVVPGLISYCALLPSLELLNRIGVQHVHDHDVRLAARVRRALGLQETRSAIVSLQRPNAAELLQRAGVRATARGDRVRMTFHLYNSDADVDLVLTALGA